MLAFRIEKNSFVVSTLGLESFVCVLILSTKWYHFTSLSLLSVSSLPAHKKLNALLVCVWEKSESAFLLLCWFAVLLLLLLAQLNELKVTLFFGYSNIIISFSLSASLPVALVLFLLCILSSEAATHFLVPHRRTQRNFWEWVTVSACVAILVVSLKKTL